MRSTVKKLLCAMPALALIMSATVTNFSDFARAADAKAKSASEAGFNETQKAEVRQMIKEYILANPEVVIESFKIFQEKQQRDSLAASKDKIAQFNDALVAKGLPGAGNADGDVTVVEFFDYNCGYCKKAIEDIKGVLNDDKNVRFVFFDMPILGPSSMTAAQWAHAAQAQGKFFEFHTAMLEHNGGIDESVLADVAKKVGMDVDKAKKDAADPATMDSINKSLQMGHDIGVQGTPGFVINGQLYPGYMGEDGMKQAIKDARDAKKT